jgi:hypothetical protein
MDRQINLTPPIVWFFILDSMFVRKVRDFTCSPADRKTDCPAKLPPPKIKTYSEIGSPVS